MNYCGKENNYLSESNFFCDSKWQLLFNKATIKPSFNRFVCVLANIQTGLLKVFLSKPILNKISVFDMSFYITHTHKHTRIHSHMHAHTNAHANAHTYTNVHTHKCTHKCAHKCNLKKQIFETFFLLSNSIQKRSNA